VFGRVPWSLWSPGGFAIFEIVICQPLRFCAIGIHHVDFPVAFPVSFKSDLAAVGVGDEGGVGGKVVAVGAIVTVGGAGVSVGTVVAVGNSSVAVGVVVVGVGPIGVNATSVSDAPQAVTRTVMSNRNAE
jgi:hypothetical protein